MRLLSDSRQLQQDFEVVWEECERMLGRPLEPEEIEELAETLIPE
jgi:hypothetical protein